MSVDTKLCLHNITSRTPRNYGSKTCILHQKETQKLEVVQ